MDAKNLLLIMADEFTSAHLGCAGHPLVKTPNLDKLAASGTRFRSAYTNGPICIPARASFATGRYLHEIGNWDNAFPYTGETPGWGHRLQSANVP
ncbi:MAG: sulfatase-like hydrolase/transferase, partial [Proteobacteria bacterium]|nr:sulfatase-like hydrolase/transferase [Pseudomonadota bacterium]